MSNSPKDFLALVLCSAALAGCATTHPVNYQGLASASQLDGAKDLAAQLD